MQCPRHGRYFVSNSIKYFLRNKDDAFKAKLGGWLYDQGKLGALPEIMTYTIDLINETSKLPFAEKPNRLLNAMVDITKEVGERILIPEEKHLVCAIHASDVGEVNFVSDLLVRQGFLSGSVYKYAVTPEGFIRDEEIRSKTQRTSQAFVAIWFSPEMANIFNQGFQKAISEAGFLALRIDQKEHTNKIDDEIIAEIRRSRFVVADFTGHRGGVYFEAGFAMGLNLPVIWTCRKDNMSDLHFDIRQFNCIDWRDVEDLKNRLKYRILAIIGEGSITVDA